MKNDMNISCLTIAHPLYTNYASSIYPFQQIPSSSHQNVSIFIHTKTTIISHSFKVKYLKAARIPLGKISLTGEAQNLPKKKTVITKDATRRGCARSRPFNCVPAKINAPPTARPMRRLSQPVNDEEKYFNAEDLNQ
jgi:hypothetical protein